LWRLPSWPFPTAPVRSILLATTPALLFFWVIVPPLAAIVIWIGVLSSGFSDRRAVPAAS